MTDFTDKKAILAIETSESVCSICIYFSDDIFFSSSVSLKYSHSEKIFELIESLFSLAGISSSHLDSVAVSAGPGSFTGLRIGMSAAKGIAYGAGLPVIPVPTYEAFALQLCNTLGNNDEFIIANKMNSEEVYYSRFQIRGNSYIFAEELKLLKNDSFIGKSAHLPVYGNAAVLLNIPVKYPLVADPFFIAKWAAGFGINVRTFDYDLLEPLYLKDFIIKEKNK